MKNDAGFPAGSAFTLHIVYTGINPYLYESSKKPIHKSIHK